jgi:replicative DNA helicase
MPPKESKKLIDYAGEDRVISSLEMSVILAEQKRPAFHINSNIPALDELVDGFNGGELITISGYTKNGKTLLAQTLTVNFIRQKSNPLWFSYEVPTRDFLAKFPEFPTIFMPAKLKAYALDWVEERIMESFEKYHTRIIFIDHLHFLFDMARAKNTSLEIGTVIRRLKGLCIENEFVIFLLCHTKKGKDDSLSYDSIRDSSLVAQESDSVILIRRTPAVNEDSAECKVEFHRRTGVFEKGFRMIKKNGLLYEWEGPDEQGR